MFPDSRVEVTAGEVGHWMDDPPLAGGRLHEIHAEAADWAAALVFALVSTGPDGSKRDGSKRDGPVLLARAPQRGPLRLVPYGPGLAGLGIDPGRLLLVQARDGLGLLRAGLDGVRCPGVAAVVVETWGKLPEYDLTASRRLVLAAERSRVPIIVLRGDAEPRASAAHSRWRIRAAPSTALAARAPGPPAIVAELLRQRGGPAGLDWKLEWNEHHGDFREIAPRIDESRIDESRRIGAPPLFGALVSLSAVRAQQARSRAA